MLKLFLQYTFAEKFIIPESLDYLMKFYYTHNYHANSFYYCI